MSEPVQPILQSGGKEDAITKTKTIYDVGAFEIFWRNFLAGLSRAMGGIFLYLLFVSVFSAIFTQFMLPKLMPLFNSFTQATNSLNSLQQLKLPSQFSLPNSFPSMQFSQ